MRRRAGLAAVHRALVRQHHRQRPGRARAPSRRARRCAIDGSPAGSTSTARSRAAWSTASRRSTTAADRAFVAERFGVDDRWPVITEPFTAVDHRGRVLPAGARRSTRSACSSSPTCARTRCIEDPAAQRQPLRARLPRVARRPAAHRRGHGATRVFGAYVERLMDRRGRAAAAARARASTSPSTGARCSSGSRTPARRPARAAVPRGVGQDAAPPRAVDR